MFCVSTFLKVHHDIVLATLLLLQFYFFLELTLQWKYITVFYIDSAIRGGIFRKCGCLFDIFHKKILLDCFISQKKVYQSYMVDTILIIPWHQLVSGNDYLLKRIVYDTERF